MYKLAGILTVIAQLLVGFVVFYLHRPKEGVLGILFGIANGIIYLWR